MRNLIQAGGLLQYEEFGMYRIGTIFFDAIGVPENPAHPYSYGYLTDKEQKWVGGEKAAFKCSDPLVLVEQGTI